MRKQLRLKRRELHIHRCGFFATEAGVHSQRVGLKLALCSKDLHMQASLLKRVGLLRDVGKAKVKQSVLYKPDTLTDAEKAVVAQHTLYGWQILEGAEPEVREAALRHHSVRAGGALWLQVLHLIDIEDALSNKRCYKAAMPESKVRKILKEESEELDSEAARIFWKHFYQFKTLN